MDEAAIRYYPTKEDPEPVGVIDIRNAEVSVCSGEDYPPFCFLVLTAAPDKKEHYFAASEAREMQDWMDAILHYMSDEHRRRSLSEIDPEQLSADERKVLTELYSVKEGIMALKEACLEAKGDVGQVPPELIELGLKGQSSIQKWVSGAPSNIFVRAGYVIGPEP